MKLVVTMKVFVRMMRIKMNKMKEQDISKEQEMARRKAARGTTASGAAEAALYAQQSGYTGASNTQRKQHSGIASTRMSAAGNIRTSISGLRPFLRASQNGAMDRPGSSSSATALPTVVHRTSANGASDVDNLVSRRHGAAQNSSEVYPQPPRLMASGADLMSVLKKNE